MVQTAPFLVIVQEMRTCRHKQRELPYGEAVVYYFVITGLSLSSYPVAPEEDPNAPKPVGPNMQPAVGVPVESRHHWHRSLEAAVQHYSSTLAKSPAISVVDPHGKVSVAATYSE